MTTAGMLQWLSDHVIRTRRGCDRLLNAEVEISNCSRLIVIVIEPPGLKFQPRRIHHDRQHLVCALLTAQLGLDKVTACQVAGQSKRMLLENLWRAGTTIRSTGTILSSDATMLP